jgi:hypothetical protein
MRKLTVVFFIILFTNFSFGQKSENKIFEASKGKWEMPIKYYSKIFDNEEMKHYFAHQFDSTLRIITDSCYQIKSVHSGKIIMVYEVDSSKFAITVKFGNYYLTYSLLQNLCVKKGDYITASTIIGSLAKDFDEFNLEIGLHFKEKELSAKNWINWHSKKQLK